MNFLAHLYLSGKDPDLILGNYIGDHVKGRDLSAYQEKVALGIRLHRQIDHFTDTHEVSGKGRYLLRPSMGKYAGVVLDMFYDHFLATKWSTHHEKPLHQFVSDSYSGLNLRKAEMPAPAQNLFHYMKKGDWLYSYKDITGVETALQHLSTRVRNGEAMRRSGVELRDNYDELSGNFDDFFPHLKENCRVFLKGNGLGPTIGLR